MSRDVPADLATLAWAAPGQELEVRSVLYDADGSCHSLRQGDLLRCRDITREGPVFTTAARSEIHLPWRQAELVQVERIGFTGTKPFWRVGPGQPLVTRRRAKHGDQALRAPAQASYAKR